ncbi:class I SAM-dependent methyltransferase [Amycolatopsis suaedae]|uniref:Class I SAM-dependent methyltransferase n=1 Tax=Amycolatopsis suaedae TaxID=2510978 RepID=A0A4Q7JDT2_9PSEU|nr:class I SAM-dependent methyltransferase [Amycolatopsis suaedae]RZQ64813.1 class I SAM-dependent methyltransferase [Amycolatopsis suaedae]
MLWDKESRVLRRRKAEILPSPNIWYHAGAYEIENRAQDADGEIWRVLAGLRDWAGLDVVDVGCGDGFHLPLFAERARSVIGVEPHAPLLARARKRIADHPTISVKRGAAQRIPLPDASADLVHARTAYFFGPGCEPGLLEAERVLRPGGTLAIVDLDVSAEPYGRWMRSDLPHYDPVEVEKFFAGQGFSCRRVATRWRFTDVESMESVLRIEFSPRVARLAIAEVMRDNGVSSGEITIPVGYRVHVRNKPTGMLLPHSSSSDSGSSSPRML